MEFILIDQFVFRTQTDVVIPYWCLLLLECVFVSIHISDLWSHVVAYGLSKFFKDNWKRIKLVALAVVIADITLSFFSGGTR